MNKPEGLDLVGQTFAGEVTLLKHCINRISQLPTKKNAALAMFLSEGCILKASEGLSECKLKRQGIWIGI